VTFLPTTSISVSPLCLGGNTWGWTSDRATSYAVLDAVLDGGGTFVDTADVYPAWVPGNLGGESESILGGWLQARGTRDRVVIATKVGRHPRRPTLTRESIVEGVEGALRRLGTDYIDLFYAHADDASTPLEETVAAFGEVIAAGKVRAVGASNYSAERLAEALRAADALGVPRYVAVQPHYSLMVRHEFEGPLAELCLAEQVGCMPYYSLASGFLTGKYSSVSDTTGRARAKGVSEHATERGFRILDVVRQVAASHNCAPASVALAWLRRQPAVIAPIASASRPDQVPDLLAALTLDLTGDELERLDEVSRP
jgi:aryl-alcohol dehydrogenase-like predicted oxidoreductase